MSVHSSTDDWQSVHLLPPGTILIDDYGTAYQVGNRGALDETWINPVSDEYAFIVTQELVGEYRPSGNLTEIWRPTDA